MNGHAIGVQVHCRADQKNALLLEMRQEIFRQEHIADQNRFRFDHVWPECLGAENVRDKAKPLQKERERHEAIGAKLHAPQVWA